jgi:ABC-2 type transport system ATP-binding protein
MQKSRNVGRFVLIMIDNAHTAGSGPAIEVRNLEKIYATRTGRHIHAVDGLSFEVPRGQIFGLLGPNGAGKTTTIKVLTTLLLPTAGTVRVLGFDVRKDPLAVRQRICVVVQENAIELHLSVRNNFRVFGRFHSLSAAETQRKMDRVSELFGLREYMNEKGMDLSGGLKRRVQVAKTFLVDTPLVFLDEATTGMDTFNKRATVEAIREESRKGRTIVLTTHVLDEAEVLCDSVAIMNHGKLIAHGSVENVKSAGLRLLTVSLTPKVVTDEILRLIKTHNPLSVEVRNGTIDVTLREESVALDILTAVRAQGKLRHFEITAASLEDVFVQLLDNKSGTS